MQSAEKGNHRAQYLLGLMFYHGKGCAQDYKAAFKWSKRAADQGFWRELFALRADRAG